MAALFDSLAAAFQESAGTGEEEDTTGVEALLERISEAIRLEDRREAMTSLRDAIIGSSAAQLALSSVGLHVLIEVLLEREDPELMRGSLEVLINAVTTTAAPSTSSAEAQAAAVNASLLIREAGNVELLLSLLEDEDFYLKYHSTQVLTALLPTSGAMLGGVLLASPMGIPRLMDMMREREVIRNEALLLLVGLAKANEEVQKIMVFEGAYERLVALIRDEGGIDGGVLVQDCLELLNNLLRNNVSNQVFFRESLFLAFVPELLTFKGTSAGQLSRQQIANLLCALETASLLTTARPDPRSIGVHTSEKAVIENRETNQKFLVDNNLLSLLIPLALEGRVSSVAVRTAAFFSIGDLIAANKANQDTVGSASIGGGLDIPVLDATIRVCLRSHDASERAGANHLLKSYLEFNPEGQQILAATIVPVGVGVDNLNSGMEEVQSFGTMLVRSLVGIDGRCDLMAAGRAAAVLCYVLAGNSAAKEQVLTLPIDLSASDENATLMPRIVRYMQEAPLELGSPAGTYTVQATMLKLLTIWLHDCPKAVHAFLKDGLQLPMCTDMAIYSESPVVGGLAAFLIATCLLHCQDGVLVTQALDTVASRLGLARFFGRIDALTKCEEFVATSKAPREIRAVTRLSAAEVMDKEEAGHSNEVGCATSEPPSLDFEYNKFLLSAKAGLGSTIAAMYAKPPTASQQVIEDYSQGNDALPDYMTRLKRILVTRDAEIHDLRTRNAVLAEGASREGAAAPSSTVKQQEGVSEPNSLGVDVKKVEMNALRKAAEAEAAAENAKLAAAQAKQEAAEAHKLMEAAKLKCLEAEEVSAKSVADLEALIGAYNGLEKQNMELEARLQAANGNVTSSIVGYTAEEIEKAKNEAVEEVKKESDAELNDLLICLGQEEAKCQAMRERLEELGEDVDSLLENVVEEEEEDEEDEDD